MSSVTVAFSQCREYEREAVEAAVKEQFKLLKIGESITPKMKVVLKPNLLMRRAPERFTTTHPLVVEAVARELIALGARVSIIDSPGGPFNPQLLYGVYRGCKMDEAAKNSGAELSVNTGFRDVKCKNFTICSSFTILDELADADMVINLPKLKTHGMTTLSSAVKNLFGAVPGLQKPELHWRYKDTDTFCGMLIDLALLISPRFTILDAVVSMQGDGPSSGEARATGFLAGSGNVFELDSVIADITGLSDAPTVRLSRKRGLSTGDVKILGEKPPVMEPFLRPKSNSAINFTKSVPGFMRPAVAYLGNTLLKPRPMVSKKVCIGCEKCAESCPAKVIAIRDKKAQIDYSGCIGCYCCHEMCPVGAVKIKRLSLFNL